jgi:hypothetical protein
VPPAKKQPIPVDMPITKRDVVAAFIEGVHSLGQELEAYRRFGAEVSAFLGEKGLGAEFEARRKKAGKRKR